MKRIVYAIAFCTWCAACASGPEICRKDPITGSRQCQRTSGSAGEAVGTAVAAGVVWGAAGCTINGCEPPYRCNSETKLCERTPCDEGNPGCPPGYTCDLEEKVCR